MKNIENRSRVSATGVPMNLWNVKTVSNETPTSETEALAIVDMEDGAWKGTLWGTVKTMDKWLEGLNDYEGLIPVKWDSTLKDFVEI